MGGQGGDSIKTQCVGQWQPTFANIHASDGALPSIGYSPLAYSDQLWPGKFITHIHRVEVGGRNSQGRWEEIPLIAKWTEGCFSS